MEDYTFLAFIIGMFCGVSFMAWLWTRCDSNSALEPPRTNVVPIERVVERCVHPFAVCKCNEKFFLLYNDLMFAPAICPSCGKSRDEMTVTNFHWIRQDWQPAQRVIDETKIKTPKP